MLSAPAPPSLVDSWDKPRSGSWVMSPATDAAAVPAAAGCLPALPQEVVAEILARVPPDVAFLFRCAVVSKLWCRVLTDPAFLRRLLPESCRRSSSLLGLIAERRLPLSTEPAPLLPSRAPAFVPAPGSALGPAPRSLASFVRDDAGVLGHAEPLAAHDGLLLLRASPRPADNKILRLCVCNLLTGSLDVLPPLTTGPLDGEGVRGYAVVTAADHGAAAPPPQPADGYSTSFQVLLIGVHSGDNQLHLHRFSSASAAAGVCWIAAPTSCFLYDLNWSATPSNCCLWNAATNTDCHRRKQEHLSHGCRAATICYGNAHWILQWGKSLFIHRVSLDDSWRFGTNKLMMDVFYWFNVRLCLSVDVNPRLSLVYVREDYLVTWTQQDGAPDYTFGFELGGLILVNMKRGRSSRVNSLATMGFGEKSGTVFVLYYSDPDSACVVDLRSRSKIMTKVTSWNESFDYRTAVPYEVNWPMFFMSRLGTRL